MKSLYRGKFQGAIKEAWENNELKLPPDMDEFSFKRIHKSLYKKAWSIRIEEKYDHGKGVMLYLARYMKGGPLNPAQIQRCDNERIEFRYKDHRDQRIKPLSLKPSDFIRRLLLHVPSCGMHTIRYYGLYAPSAKKKHERCREALGVLSDLELNASEPKPDMLLFCKKCGGNLYMTHSNWRQRYKGNSLKRSSRRGGFQQIDESDIANAASARDPCEKVA